MNSEKDDGFGGRARICKRNAGTHERLAKLLMMSMNQQLNVVKLNETKRNFGIPDDYLIRILLKYPDMFQLVNHSGRKSSMQLELLSWNPDLAVSIIEASAQKPLHSTWVKSSDRFREFNSTPYISPYMDPKDLLEGSKEMEKRTAGLVHELLSLTLWKKVSIMKLGLFKREFNVPEKLNVFLLRYPGIFYVLNKYQICTLLREAYNGSELIDKDPLVVIKDKFGEGQHEYNRAALFGQYREEEEWYGKVCESDDIDNSIDPEQECGNKSGGLFDPNGRKRFYPVLFDDHTPCK